jgi:hypothetical protein
MQQEIAIAAKESIAGYIVDIRFAYACDERIPGRRAATHHPNITDVSNRFRCAKRIKSPTIENATITHASLRAVRLSVDGTHS